MAGKKKEIQLQTTITNQDQWDEMLLTRGVVGSTSQLFVIPDHYFLVIDVYQAWCGPCKPVVNLFRRLKNEFSEDDVLHFAVAEADNIPALKPFRNTCEPVFLFCVDGKIVAIVRGVNAPLISKKITELVQEEREIAAGQKERAQVDELVFVEEQSSEETVTETAPEEEVLRYSVAIIKPDDVLEGRVEEIKQKIRDAGFAIEAAEEKMLTEEQIRVFYARNKDQPDFEDFVQFMMSGPCHVLIITENETADAIPHWRELHKLSESESEPEEPETAKPDRLEGIVESESIVNLCDVQDSVEDASRQLAFFFPNFHKTKTDKKVEKTLALIRPCILKERRKHLQIVNWMGSFQKTSQRSWHFHCVVEGIVLPTVIKQLMLFLNGKSKADQEQDSIMQRIKDDGFEIAMQKEIILSEEQVCEFYKEHVDQDYFPVLLEQMTSGPTLVLALTRENAVAHWRDLLGPKTVEEAMKENPNSLRAKYAVENIPIGQLHGSSTPDDAEKELEFFFPQEHTLALIKPDAAKDHKDDILQKVKDAGFNITKIKEAALTREMATQFYSDHEGKPFFDQLVNYMTEGPSVIMVLTKENAVEEWRQLMGPTDPELAKETCPDSIRAQFAQDILSNAVHGSSNREHALKSIECVFGEIDIN